MAHDVFISYSSKDKPTADAVCAALESRGIRCWIAPRDVLPGVPYARALVNALHESRIMALVFSSDANHSPQVLREVERAVSRGIPIIPLRIEDVVPSDEMEYYIAGRHWLDALTPPLEQHLLRLCDTVKLLLSRPADSAAPERVEPAVRPVPALADDQSAPQPPSNRLQHPDARPSTEPIQPAAETVFPTPSEESRRPAVDDIRLPSVASHTSSTQDSATPSVEPPIVSPSTSSETSRKPSAKSNNWLGIGIAVLLLVAIVLAVIYVRPRHAGTSGSEAAFTKPTPSYVFGPRFAPYLTLSPGDNLHGFVFVPGTNQILVAVGNHVDLWDVVGGKSLGQIFALQGQKDEVESLATSPDGSQIAVGDQFGHLALVDASTHVEIRTLTAPVVDQEIARLNPENPAGIDSIAFSPNGKWIALDGSNSPLMVWERLSGKLLLDSRSSCTTNEGCFSYGIAFTPDANRLLQANDKLSVFDTSTWRRVRNLDIPYLGSFAVTADSRNIVSASNSNWINMWDIHRGRQVGSLRDPDQPYDSWSVRNLTLDQSRRWVVSRHDDGAIRVWELATARLASTILAGDDECSHSHGISYRIAISPDGQFLVWELTDSSCDIDLHVWKRAE